MQGETTHQTHRRRERNPQLDMQMPEKFHVVPNNAAIQHYRAVST